jgi:FkbM family methyltransferase
VNPEEVRARLRAAYFSEAPHERALLDWLPRLLAGRRPFVDVGASLGQYTRRAAEALAGGDVVAVEADPWRFAELAREADEWQRSTGTRIRAVHAAASDVDGSLTFHVTHSDVSGGLFPHPCGKSVGFDPVTVPAVRLDTLLADLEPGLVKIDIEGGELRVLQGAESLLRSRRALFLVEIHGWGDPERGTGRLDVLRHMLRHGYLPAFLHGSWLFSPPRALWLRALLAGLPGLLGRLVRRAAGR